MKQKIYIFAVILHLVLIKETYCLKKFVEVLTLLALMHCHGPFSQKFLNYCFLLAGLKKRRKKHDQPQYNIFGFEARSEEMKCEKNNAHRTIRNKFQTLNTHFFFFAAATAALALLIPFIQTFAPSYIVLESYIFSVLLNSDI